MIQYGQFLRLTLPGFPELSTPKQLKPTLTHNNGAHVQILPGIALVFSLATLRKTTLAIFKWVKHNNLLDTINFNYTKNIAFRKILQPESKARPAITAPVTSCQNFFSSEISSGKIARSFKSIFLKQWMNKNFLREQTHSIATSTNQNKKQQKPAPSKTQILIFTDMDGSLLDHYTYSFKPAQAMLNALSDQKIPVIPTTSKTQAEVMFLRTKLRNQQPFIIENGAAVFIPVGYFPEQPKKTIQKDGFWIKEFVSNRKHWQQLLNHYPQYKKHYRSFSQMGIDGIIKATDLDHDSAVKAAQRKYGEPLQWLGSETEKQDFINQLSEQGANILQGGRFMHISGHCDKGQAMLWLIQQYQHNLIDSPMQSIAIGDSQNDQAMLEAADQAILIRSPVHELPDLKRKHGTLISTQTGPQGWSDSVTELLQTLSTKNDQP